jgi:bifunctional non-homologous end joining protein LigD
VSLATYQKKRQFNRTPEPRGRVIHKSGKTLRFVIQKHDASRLHYDFRLELGGVLKSWAVPNGPSLDPGRKVLAVQVEDHPIDYGDFEGVIPKGQYGGGTVLLWDKGTWQPLDDPVAGLKNGKLHFVLNGKKLHGAWALVRMGGRAGGDGKNWLLMKSKDEYASAERDILASAPKSVKTTRTLEQIADARDDVWNSNSKGSAPIAGAVKSSWPGQFSPQLAVLAEAPPSGDQWLHEIKFDGYRILARIKAGKVQLMTRNAKDWTQKFPNIARALSRLKVDSAIVDGEVVVQDKQGRSDFQALQAMLKNKESVEPVFFAFDLPFCDGLDLRRAKLLDRKEKLKSILEKSDLAPRVFFGDHVRGGGDAVIHKACGMGLEGIVSKRIDAQYVSRRDATWLKSKCGQRQEFVVIGYTDPQGSRTGFGSLLLGYHDGNKKLVYGGRVGTGFDERLLGSTFKQLKQLQQSDPPTDIPPPRREQRDAHWVEPKLVAEIGFTAWTRDGVLRHPVFVAFRSDKPASQIVRELPMRRQKVKQINSFGGRKSPAPAPADSGRRALAKSALKAGDDSLAGVTLTHPQRVLYPDSGTTKRDLADYYASVQQWMLPHVVGRPLALVRCPGGVASKCFFQRNWTDTLPPAIGRVDVGQGKKEFHVTVSDLAGVISLTQMSVLEIHTWNCRSDDVERPDQLVFDLDPGPDLPWKRVIEGARLLYRTLESLRLPMFLKTSGGKGLHITIPIEPTIDWDSAKSFCETIAKSLAQKNDLFVANMRKDLRGGKIYLDYNRNGRSATAVAPYSTRARAGAPISMPISWDELGRLESANHFTVETAGRYLDRRKADPWRSFERSRVDLRKLVSKGAVAEG